MAAFASDEFLMSLRALVPEIVKDRLDPTSADVELAEEKLRAGNDDYVSGGKSPYAGVDQASRISLVKKQSPFAAILCCSDSRVPPEIVHWQGLGKIFVIREAGHVLDPHGLGSIHYAIEHLKVALLVVLGHQECGAVATALKAVGKGEPLPKGPLGDLVGVIVPAVRDVCTKEDCSHSPPEQAAKRVLELCVKEHTRRTAELLSNDEVVDAQIKKGALKLMTGYYDLLSGKIVYD